MKSLLIFILLSSVVSAATLQGTIYDAELTIANNALVEIDTTPPQRMLAVNGLYSFEVPKGHYQLTVSNEIMRITESFTVEQNGTFTYDLFLLQDLSEDAALYTDITSDFEEIPLEPLTTQQSIWPLVILILFILLALTLPLLWLKSQFTKITDQVQDSEEDLILDILKQNNGRMTQKDLRVHIPQSEAKVSLMIADLESQGKIKKIKKGRGNILILQ